MVFDAKRPRFVLASEGPCKELAPELPSSPCQVGKGALVCNAEFLPMEFDYKYFTWRLTCAGPGKHRLYVNNEGEWENYRHFMPRMEAAINWGLLQFFIKQMTGEFACGPFYA